MRPVVTRRRFVLILVGVSLALHAYGAPCFADVLFYNGDPYGTGPAFLNQSNFSSSDVAQYTEFAVPAGAVWQVSGVFANTVYNLDNNQPLNSPSNTLAYYEIRSGVSDGIGGNLIDFGTVSAVPVPTGFTYAGYDGFRIEADFTPIQLSPGIYWVSIVPIGTGDNLAFVYNTQGTNGVNVVLSQQSFFTVGGGAQFAPTSTNESVGVIGTSAVPVPSSLVMSVIFFAMLSFVHACKRLKLTAAAA